MTMTDVALGGHRATQKEPPASFLFLVRSHTTGHAGVRLPFFDIFR